MVITSLFLHLSTTDICVVVAGVPGGRQAWKRIFQTGKHNTENIGSCSTLVLLSMAPSKDRGKTKSQLVESINATLFLDWNDVILLLHQLSAICLVAEVTFCGL